MVDKLKSGVSILQASVLPFEVVYRILIIDETLERQVRNALV